MITLITDTVVVPMTAREGEPEYFTGSVAFEGNRIVMVTADRQKMEEFRAATLARAERGSGATERAGDCAMGISRRGNEENGSGAGFREIDGRGKLVMPGLINTHTHVAMTLMRNMADDVPLMEWLKEYVWPFEAKLGAWEIGIGARLGIAEMLLGGTTTFIDMYWYEAAVASAAREMGVRAVLCPSFVDGVRMSEFERDLAETLDAAAGCDTLSVRIAPHAAYSCSEANLRRAIGLAREHGIGLHTHISETLDEQQIIRERYGCTPTEYLRGTGFFEVPTIAAHCVYVSDGDMEILREYGVTVAHNPQSNMKLASGAARVAEMMARGVNVSLGTDGASSNNDLDMWDEMRSASLLGKLTARNPAALPAYEILKMATVNGARAIGMEGKLGVIAEGTLADIVVLDIEKPHLCPKGNLVSALVYSAKSSDVEAVFVAGRQVVPDGKVIGAEFGTGMGTRHGTRLGATAGGGLDVRELMREAERVVGEVGGL